MNFRFLCILIIASCFLGCSGKKKQAELLEQSKPEWVKQRPIDRNYYFGIGICRKVGNPLYYEDKAKERALADIAGQINTQIQSESNYYKVEDLQGAHDYIQSRIKATSSEFLEGYEYVDKWEDLDNIYAFYKLSKQTFKELKAKRKEEALSNATQSFLDAKDKESTWHLSEALNLYAKVIDLLSGYMNEENTVELNGQRIELLTESTSALQAVIRSLSITSNQQNINSKPQHKIQEGTITVTIYSTNDHAIGNIPVKFKYSGGFLINDSGLSNEAGQVFTPEISKSALQQDEKLDVEIDLVKLGQLTSKNIYVRKLIEKERPDKLTIKIISN